MLKSSCVLLLCLGMAACKGPARQEMSPPVELKHFPLNNLEGVRAMKGVSFDPDVSCDGKGSLRADSDGQLLLPLFEITDVNVDNTALIYRASLHSDKLDGQAYLEMWVRIPGKGEFFSRGLDRPVTGTMSWMQAATPFFLQIG
jgi:hypothetical protein